MVGTYPASPEFAKLVNQGSTSPRLVQPTARCVRPELGRRGRRGMSHNVSAQGVGGGTHQTCSAVSVHQTPTRTLLPTRFARHAQQIRALGLQAMKPRIVFATRDSPETRTGDAHVAPQVPSKTQLVTTRAGRATQRNAQLGFIGLNV